MKRYDWQYVVRPVEKRCGLPIDEFLSRETAEQFARMHAERFGVEYIVVLVRMGYALTVARFQPGHKATIA